MVCEDLLGAVQHLYSRLFYDLRILLGFIKTM